MMRIKKQRFFEFEFPKRVKADERMLLKKNGFKKQNVKT
jgi:hypothetical protein